MLLLTGIVLVFTHTVYDPIMWKDVPHTHALEKTGNILACYYICMCVLPCVTFIYSYLERYNYVYVHLSGYP